MCDGALHILDYKPDARTNKPIAQLAIYALALTRLIPDLKLFDIGCAGSTSSSIVNSFRAHCWRNIANISANWCSAQRVKLLKTLVGAGRFELPTPCSRS